MICRENSTWYQGTGDQRRTIYKKEFEVYYFGYRSQVLITSISPMVFYGLRLKYALDGSSNYIAWKDHMEAVLEDNGLKDFNDQEVPKPIDATQLVEWKKFVARARRIIL